MQSEAVAARAMLTKTHPAMLQVADERLQTSSRWTRCTSCYARVRATSAALRYRRPRADADAAVTCDPVRGGKHPCPGPLILHLATARAISLSCDDARRRLQHGSCLGAH